MSRPPVVAVLAVACVLALVAAVEAAPAPAQTELRPLTKAQFDALQPVPNEKPKLRLFRPRLVVPGPWHGPDLEVVEPGIPEVLPPGSAQCTAYPWSPGLRYTWKVKNSGEAPTTGPTSVQITCELIAPAAMPAPTKAMYDARLCGCMRKNYPNRVPPIPPGKTYGDMGMPPSTVFSYISIPGVVPPCENPNAPHAKVTVKVLPRPEEGAHTANNSLVVEFCN